MNSISQNSDKSLIVISWPEKIKDEARAIQCLIELGLTHFHLRKPEWKSYELEDLILKIPERYHQHIILHNHYELAKKYGLKGIHLTNHTKNSYAVEEFKNYHISISIHTFREVQSLSSSYDYVFFSPVFESISKKGYNPAFSLTELCEWFHKQTLPTKLIALGGVTPNNLKQIKNSPFDGYATLGYIWKEYRNNPDLKEIENRFITLKNSIYEQCNKFSGVVR